MASPSCSSNIDSESVLSSSNPYSSEFSDGESIYIGIVELPYQFEPEPSDADEIPVDVPTEVPDNSSIDRVANVDW